MTNSELAARFAERKHYAKSPVKNAHDENSSVSSHISSLSANSPKIENDWGDSQLEGHTSNFPKNENYSKMSHSAGIKIDNPSNGHNTKTYSSDRVSIRQANSWIKNNLEKQKNALHVDHPMYNSIDTSCLESDNKKKKDSSNTDIEVQQSNFRTANLPCILKAKTREVNQVAIIQSKENDDISPLHISTSQDPGQIKPTGSDNKWIKKTDSNNHTNQYSEEFSQPNITSEASNRQSSSVVEISNSSYVNGTSNMQDISKEKAGNSVEKFSFFPRSKPPSNKKNSASSTCSQWPPQVKITAPILDAAKLEQTAKIFKDAADVSHGSKINPSDEGWIKKTGIDQAHDVKVGAVASIEEIEHLQRTNEMTQLNDSFQETIRFDNGEVVASVLPNSTQNNNPLPKTSIKKAGNQWPLKTRCKVITRGSTKSDELITDSGTVSAHHLKGNAQDNIWIKKEREEIDQSTISSMLPPSIDSSNINGRESPFQREMLSLCDVIGTQNVGFNTLCKDSAQGEDKLGKGHKSIAVGKCNQSPKEYSRSIMQWPPSTNRDISLLKTNKSDQIDTSDDNDVTVSCSSPNIKRITLDERYAVSCLSPNIKKVTSDDRWIKRKKENDEEGKASECTSTINNSSAVKNESLISLKELTNLNIANVASHVKMKLPAKRMTNPSHNQQVHHLSTNSDNSSLKVDRVNSFDDTWIKKNEMDAGKKIISLGNPMNIKEQDRLSQREVIKSTTNSRKFNGSPIKELRDPNQEIHQQSYHEPTSINANNKDKSENESKNISCNMLLNNQCCVQTDWDSDSNPIHSIKTKSFKDSNWIKKNRAEEVKCVESPTVTNGIKQESPVAKDAVSSLIDASKNFQSIEEKGQLLTSSGQRDKLTYLKSDGVLNILHNSPKRNSKLVTEFKSSHNIVKTTSEFKTQKLNLKVTTGITGLNHHLQKSVKKTDQDQAIIESDLRSKTYSLAEIVLKPNEAQLHSQQNCNTLDTVNDSFSSSRFRVRRKSCVDGGWIKKDATCISFEEKPLIATSLLSHEHNKESLAVSSITGILPDIDENLHHAVDVEQSRKSLGSIEKDEKYKMNKIIGKYQLSPGRKISNTKDVTPLIVHQKIIAENLDLPPNIHNTANQFDNDQNSNNTTMLNKLVNNNNRISKKSKSLQLKTTSRRPKLVKVKAFDSVFSKIGNKKGENCDDCLNSLPHNVCPSDEETSTDKVTRSPKISSRKDKAFTKSIVNASTKVNVKSASKEWTTKGKQNHVGQKPSNSSGYSNTIVLDKRQVKTNVLKTKDKISSSTGILSHSPPSSTSFKTSIIQNPLNLSKIAIKDNASRKAKKESVQDHEKTLYETQNTKKTINECDALTPIGSLLHPDGKIRNANNLLKPSNVKSNPEKSAQHNALTLKASCPPSKGDVSDHKEILDKIQKVKKINDECDDFTPIVTVEGVDTSITLLHSSEKVSSVGDAGDTPTTNPDPKEIARPKALNLKPPNRLWKKNRSQFKNNAIDQDSRPIRKNQKVPILFKSAINPKQTTTPKILNSDTCLPSMTGGVGSTEDIDKVDFKHDETVHAYPSDYTESESRKSASKSSKCIVKNRSGSSSITESKNDALNNIFDESLHDTKLGGNNYESKAHDNQSKFNPRSPQSSFSQWSPPVNKFNQDFNTIKSTNLIQQTDALIGFVSEASLNKMSKAEERNNTQCSPTNFISDCIEKDDDTPKRDNLKVSNVQISSKTKLPLLSDDSFHTTDNNDAMFALKDRRFLC